MKERLIELMSDFYYEIESITIKDIENIADKLLENGVIVPPYKVGDTVYVIADNLYWKANVLSVWYRRSKYKEDDIVAVGYGDGEIKSFYGREIYFTKEEAEQALKESGVGVIK